MSAAHLEGVASPSPETGLGAVERSAWPSKRQADASESSRVSWIRSWRADPIGARLADRHYNRQKVGAKQFVPPGGCVVFVTPCERAVWVTSTPKREFVKHQWAGAWINSLFRNEGAGLSSALIRSAVRASIEALAAKGVDVPWRGMVSFVDADKTAERRSRRSAPGECFLRAGFVDVGRTKQDELIALQLRPSRMPGLPPYVPSGDVGPARVGRGEA